MISPRETHYQLEHYATAVAADHTLYVSLAGLDTICQAAKFLVLAPSGYPLRFADGGIVIFNAQGVAIDALTTPQLPHFTMLPSVNNNKSDRLLYFRHSFAQYCTAHRPGGTKEVDTTDPNWHRDGSPHVDYATLIFAIVGHFRDGSMPRAGRVTFELDIETEMADGLEPWQIETDEEETRGPFPSLGGENIDPE